ncbi:MAG: AraC family transcriptional regulator [Chloroflexi bacterium]|nr:MAG: AraC family transcriptional regulator [Chloroflexota bacterium]
MSYNCEVKEQPAQPVLSIRTRTPVQQLPQVLGEVYGKIGQYLGERQQPPAGAPFAAYYNMDIEDLDVEIGFPVATKLAGKDDIQANEIPEGHIASCLHVGPYNEVGPAYKALTQYVKEQGFEPTGIAYEFYLNDPMENPPEALQTQVLFTLKN